MSRVSRAFYVAKNAEDKAKAIEARLANQTRLAKLAQTPDGNSKSSMLSFDQTLDAAAESAMFGTPDEIAAKLVTLRAAGVEHVLLNGPAGSRENLRAFARDVMPAFAGPAAEPAVSRRQPQLANLVVHKPVPRAFGGIPPLIKRNTVLFALSQSFVGAGTQLAYGIGPLMVIAVTGSASLAGLTVGLFGISRFLVSYPVGRITDTYGRKPGILFGQGAGDDRHLLPPAWRCSPAAPSG